MSPDDVNFFPPTVLANYPADCRSVINEPIRSVNSSGFSGARLWRWTSATKGNLVLRRWPVQHPTEDRLRFIHGVLRHLAENGIDFIAPPCMTANGATFVWEAGHLWELAPWLPGHAISEGTRPSNVQLSNAGQAVAHLHLAAQDFDCSSRTGQVSPGISERAAKLSQLLQSGYARLTNAVNSPYSQPAEQFLPLATELIGLFPVAAPLVWQHLKATQHFAVALQPCLRDIWREHVLFEGDQVTGIVDYGALRTESVAADLARLFSSLAEDRPADWLQGVAAYEAMRPMSPEERQLIVALDVSGTLLSASNWLEWLFVEQRQFSNREGVLSRLATILRRLHHLAKVGVTAEVLLE